MLPEACGPGDGGGGDDGGGDAVAGDGLITAVGLGGLVDIGVHCWY